jgi:hypothetical protein
MDDLDFVSHGLMSLGSRQGIAFGACGIVGGDCGAQCNAWLRRSKIGSDLSKSQLRWMPFYPNRSVEAATGCFERYSRMPANPASRGEQLGIFRRNHANSL